MKTRAKKGERCMTVTAKMSREQYRKLKTMSKIGGKSIYALVNLAVDSFIRSQDVPGFPLEDTFDPFLDGDDVEERSDDVEERSDDVDSGDDDCALYCNEDNCGIVGGVKNA